MKITINLENFWTEENDTDLRESVVRNIKHEVTNEVKKSIKEQVDREITAKVIETIRKGIETQIGTYIEDFIKVGKVRSSRTSNEITIEEYVKELFTYQSGWGSKTEEVKKLASALGQEMKNRYDLLFASQLVSKMNEAGLLRSEVAQMLLEKK